MRKTSSNVMIFTQGREPGRMIEAPVTKCDSGTQTDTHFMESNIVKSYEWNEWELRRKALKLVSDHKLYFSIPHAWWNKTLQSESEFQSRKGNPCGLGRFRTH